jgi:hypothetical protein
MRTFAGRGAVALLAVLACAQPASALLQISADGSRPDERLVVLDVPYIPQSEALCGGAAVAMLLRYWGERGVQAEDFRAYITPATDGIRTADLVAAVRARGWTAQPFTGDEPTVRAHLTAGRPIIALIEVGPARFHYVVVVAWADGGVLVHDPAGAPFRSFDTSDFLDAWAGSGSWSLLVQPAGSALPYGSGSAERPVGMEGGVGLPPPWKTAMRSASLPADSQGMGATAGTAPAHCAALLAGGIDAAVRDDLTAADRMLGIAAEQCPDSAPIAVELAGIRFRQERYAEAAALAGAAAAAAPNDPHAWRLLAASRFMAGDEVGALDAWNRTGTPVHDLISIAGLERMRFQTVAAAIGIPPGETITAAALGRARRRVFDLPAVRRARIDFVPRAEGLADIDAAIVERPAYPRAWPDLLATAGRAIAQRELALELVGLAHAGERWRGHWRWSDARSALGVSLDLPAPRGPGIWQIAGSRTTESYALDAPSRELASSRRSFTVTFSDWASRHAAWSIGAAADHWDGRGTFGAVLLGGRAQTLNGNVGVGVQLAGWAGAGAPFGRLALDAGARIPVTRSFETALTAAIALTNGSAPLDLWNGTGTGEARTPLLRAHPLLDDGDRVASDFFAPRLLAATVEARRWLLEPLPGFRFGLAAFLDAAAAFGPAPLRQAVDAGAGLRVRLADAGTLRFDVAAGVTERARAFSVGFEPPARAR